MFYGEIWLIILKFSCYPFLSGALIIACSSLERYLCMCIEEKLISQCIRAVFMEYYESKKKRANTDQFSPVL